MATSGNGWPASPISSEIGIVDFTIKGVSFGGIKGGDVHKVLSYVATEVAERVEMPIAGQCGGWAYRPNVNNPSSLSNHSSGTAIDYNSLAHPNAVATSSTWTAVQIAQIHVILAEVGGVVRWGGDYNSTPDAMHFELDVGPEDDRLALVAANLGEGGGTGGDPGGGGGSTGTTVGEHFWRDAPLLEYGTRSALTPSAALVGEDPDPGAANAVYGNHAAWWKVQFPADHDPATVVRFDTVETTTSVPEGELDTVITVFAGVPADELQANEIFHTDDRFIPGVGVELRADGDTSGFEPGQVVYVQVGLWSSDDVEYVLRVGTLGPAVEYTEWVTPELEVGIFSRHETTSELGWMLDWELGLAEPDDAGVLDSDTQGDLIVSVIGGEGSFGRTGAFRTVICPPVFFHFQANYPLRNDVHVGNVMQGTLGYGVTGGEEHNYADDAPNGGLVYPSGLYVYSDDASLGFQGSAFTFSQHPMSHGIVGIGDRITCSTGSAVAPAWVYRTPMLNADDGELLEDFALNVWRPADFEPSDVVGAEWQRKPGSAEVLPKVDAVIYWLLEQDTYAEPRDRAVWAWIPYWGERSPGEEGPETNLPYIFTEAKVLATEPMVVEDNPSRPQDRGLFHYERIHLPDNWRPNGQDRLVCMPSLCFADAYGPATLPGMSLPHGLPLDNLWTWRGGPGGGGSDPEALRALWEQGSDGTDAYDRTETTQVNGGMRFEYTYQPPEHRWMIPLERSTLETVSTATLTAEFTHTTQDNGFITDFDGSPSESSGTIVSYTWDWGDPLVDDQPYEGQQVPHFYRVAPMTYMVTLTVTDDTGASDSVTHPVDMAGPAITGDYLDGQVQFTG